MLNSILLHTLHALRRRVRNIWSIIMEKGNIIGVSLEQLGWGNYQTEVFVITFLVKLKIGVE